MTRRVFVASHCISDCLPLLCHWHKYSARCPRSLPYILCPYRHPDIQILYPLGRGAAREVKTSEASSVAQAQVGGPRIPGPRCHRFGVWALPVSDFVLRRRTRMPSFS
jgi:hypothetical protein